MLDNQLIRLINIASNNLSLNTSVIEKDYYVTRLIHALSNLENKHFKLIFAGGTCLAKAHKIVKRMSEDVDFKVQIKDRENNFSRSRLTKELAIQDTNYFCACIAGFYYKRDSSSQRRTVHAH